MSDWMEIHALADGELSGESKRLAEAKLAASSELRAEFDAVLALKSTLKAKCQDEASEALWSACSARLDEIDRTRRVERFVGKYAWGLCAVFFAVILSAGVMNRSFGLGELGTGDVAKVVASLGGSSRASNDGEDMRKWIRNASITLETGSMRVAGFREGIHEGRQFGVFYLVGDGEQLTLVAVRGLERFDGTEPISPESRYAAGQIDQYNCVTWNDRGFGLMLIGAGDCGQLCSAADNIGLR